jgi:NTP pyrophosphatase (non-canonical NTP hydrolase)
MCKPTWIDTGVHYHGSKVVVNSLDGTMALQDTGGNLESVTEELEDLVTDILIMVEQVKYMDKDVLQQQLEDNRSKGN